MSKSTVFKAALRSADWGQASCLVRESPDLLTKQDGRGNSFVSYAMQDGRWEEASWLLEYGASWCDAMEGWLVGGLDAGALEVRLMGEANASDWLQTGSCSMWGRLWRGAIQAKRMDVLELLLRKGVECGLCQAESCWSGWLVAFNDFDEGICQFMWHSGSITRPSHSQLSSLAMMNVGRGNLAAMAWLLHMGLDLNQPDLDGKSLLVFASRMGREKVCEWLVDHGALVDRMDSSGRTGLYEAVAHGHEACAKILLDHGADPEKRQGLRGQGGDPMRLASKSGAREVRKLLAASLERRVMNNAVAPVASGSETARRL